MKRLLITWLSRWLGKKILAAKIAPKPPFITFEMGLRLMARLEYIKLQPQHILIVGKSSDFAWPLLKKRFPQARIHNDPSLAAKSHYFDLIFANACVFKDGGQELFGQWQQLLKKDGLVLFSSLGPDTFKELQSILETINARELFNDLLTDMHILGDVLLKMKFSDSVVDMQFVTLAYRKLSTLLRDIQASTLNDWGQAAPFAISYRDLHQKYEKYRQPHSKLLPATLEIIYGHAWGQGLTTLTSCSSQTKKTKMAIPLAIKTD